MTLKSKEIRHLSTQEQIFCEAYFLTSDLVGSVRRAEYVQATKPDLDVNGYGRKLLTRYPIQLYLHRLRTDKIKPTLLTAESAQPSVADTTEACSESPQSLMKSQGSEAVKEGTSFLTAPFSGAAPPATAGLETPGSAPIMAELVHTEYTKAEIRQQLAMIGRGKVRGMRDARTRMRAIELAMRNMGMLVDVQVTADMTPKPTLSKAERDAEMARLEAMLASAELPESPDKVNPS